MKVLHKHAPQTSIQDVQKVIHEDLDRCTDELFSSFEDEPVASASLAQVHRAVRRSDGKLVAVKVQHPNVKSHATVDMATMEVQCVFRSD